MLSGRLTEQTHVPEVCTNMYTRELRVFLEMIVFFILMESAIGGSSGCSCTFSGPEFSGLNPNLPRIHLRLIFPKFGFVLVLSESEFCKLASLSSYVSKVSENFEMK